MPTTKKIVRKTITFFLVVVLVLVVLLPFSWMVITSFKRDLQIYTPEPRPFAWTDPFWANYYMLLFGRIPPQWGGTEIPGSRLQRVPVYSEWFVHGFVNTIYTSSITTLLCLVVGSLSAYAFVTTKFPGKDRLYVAYFATRTIPSAVLLIPTFLVFKVLRLLDSNEAIIIVTTGILLPYIVWILKEYFSSIPRDLYDAARVDGCSRFGILWRVFLPVAVPGLIAAGIFCFMAVWNSFLIALILSRTTDSMQMSVYVSNFITDIDIDVGFMNTAGVFATIPAVVLALLFQKYIVQGLMQGAIKG